MAAPASIIKEEADKYVKICEWCKRPFHPTHGNQKYHPGQCQEEAKREKTRLRVRKYNKRYEWFLKKKNIEKLGTFDLNPFKLANLSEVTYMGVSIFCDAWTEEYEEIHELAKFLCVRSLDKGNRQGTQHKGATLNDYSDFSITLLLENPPPCPICGEQLQEKDLTRCELVCRNPDCTGHEGSPEEGFEGLGGLVLRGTHHGICYPEVKAKMGFTSQDIAKAQWTKGTEGELTTQMVAWSNYWQNK